MFCSNCGKEISNESVFCGYCGNKVIVPVSRAPEYNQVMTAQNVSVQQPKKKSPLPVIIVSAVVSVLALAILCVVLYRINQNEYIDLEEDIELAEYEEVESEEEVEPEEEVNPEEEDPLDEDDGVVATIDDSDDNNDENVSEDMTGHILYASDDGVTCNENSYWEFVDDKKAMLHSSDGSCYICDYLVKIGTEGMEYTSQMLPEYGLTFDELNKVTKARMKGDPNCIGYVLIVFENVEVYDEDGDQTESGNGSVVPYYGCNYDVDGQIVYDLVGANSANTYTFIDRS